MAAVGGGGPKAEETEEEIKIQKKQRRRGKWEKAVRKERESKTLVIVAMTAAVNHIYNDWKWNTLLADYWCTFVIGNQIFKQKEKKV